MVDFFNHLFYRIYWWNKTIVKEKDFTAISSLLGVSMFHIINISTIIFFYFLYVHKDPTAYPDWVQLMLMFFILALDYFIYIYNGKYKLIIEDSEKESKRSLRKKDQYLILYLCLTFGFLIWIIIKSREFLLL